MNQYQLVTDNEEFALTVTEVNDHLKTDFTTIESDPYLAMLVKAVETFGEDFTKRTFTQKTYRLYANSWAAIFLLRRAPLIKMEDVKYLDVSNAEITVASSNYYTSFSSMFASLIFESSFDCPTLSDRFQAVRIRFNAGYGIDNENIPKPLKAAMLNHLAELYANRGDCKGSATPDFMLNNLPDSSRLLYSNYIIREICL